MRDLILTTKLKDNVSFSNGKTWIRKSLFRIPTTLTISKVGYSLPELSEITTLKNKITTMGREFSKDPT